LYLEAFPFGGICPASYAVCGTDPISTNIADDSTGEQGLSRWRGLHGVRRHGTFGTDQAKG
jgi:hypothetical protein